MINYSESALGVVSECVRYQEKTRLYWLELDVVIDKILRNKKLNND